MKTIINHIQTTLRKQYKNKHIKIKMKPFIIKDKETQETIQLGILKPAYIKHATDILQSLVHLDITSCEGKNNLIKQALQNLEMAKQQLWIAGWKTYSRRTQRLTDRIQESRNKKWRQ